jgi:hypothetical protein
MRSFSRMRSAPSVSYRQNSARALSSALPSNKREPMPAATCQRQMPEACHVYLVWYRRSFPGTIEYHDNQRKISCQFPDRYNQPGYTSGGILTVNVVLGCCVKVIIGGYSVELDERGRKTGTESQGSKYEFEKEDQDELVSARCSPITKTDAVFAPAWGPFCRGRKDEAEQPKV